MDFLSSLGIRCTIQEANHLVNVLDFDDNGRVDYSDFSDAILP